MFRSHLAIMQTIERAYFNQLLLDRARLHYLTNASIWPDCDPTLATLYFIWNYE